MIKDVYIGDLVNRISLATFSKQRDVLNIGGMEVPLTVDTGLIGTLRANSKNVTKGAAITLATSAGIAAVFLGGPSVVKMIQGLHVGKWAKETTRKVKDLATSMFEEGKNLATKTADYVSSTFNKPINPYISSVPGSASMQKGIAMAQADKALSKLRNHSENTNFSVVDKVSGWVNGIFDNMKSYDEASLMGMIKSANKIFTDAFNDVEIEKLKKMGFMIYVKKNKTYIYTGLISKNADKYSPKNYKSQFTKIDTLKDHLSVV